MFDAGSPASAPPSLLSQFGPLITPVISVLLSALVAWWTAKRVATKANLRVAIDSVLDELDRLHDLSADLLLIAGTDVRAHGLLQDIALCDFRIGRRLTEIFRSCQRQPGTTASQPVPVGVLNARMALRQIVTDSDLVTATRLPYTATDPMHQQLADACGGLRSEIREQAENLGVGDLQ